MQSQRGVIYLALPLISLDRKLAIVQYVHLVHTVHIVDKIISVAEVRQSLAEVLGQVAFGQQSFLVTKKGKPLARIVPVEQREQTAPRSLAEVSGWLDNDDPFFGDLEQARRNAGLVRSAFRRQRKV